MTLESLIAPITLDDFFGTYFGKTHLITTDSSDRFTTLLSWSDVEEMLAFQRLNSASVMLAKDGQVIPPASFLKFRFRNNVPHCSLLNEEFNSLLADGATLVLNRVDEVNRTICALASALEQVFCVGVQVNLYASWSHSAGFPVHRDQHDVLVLQILGRKRWTLLGRSEELSCDGNDGVPTPASPPSKIVWEGFLSAGNCMYLPRGFWHSATPCDEATLHLTVGITNPNGTDFLHWLVSQLGRKQVLANDVPSPWLTGLSASNDYLSLLTTELTLATASETLLNQFWEAQRRKIEPRSQPRMPKITTSRCTATER